MKDQPENCASATLGGRGHSQHQCTPYWLKSKWSCLKTLFQLTSLWRTSANGLRCSVGSPTADGHTLTLSHGTQHTQHLKELSFCVSQQARCPHQQKYERTQGWPMESSHPKSSELGLSPATVHSKPPFQVCNCPQPPFSTFLCTSLTLGSFLLSRPPWNTSFLCEMDNVSNTGEVFMFCFPFYMTDNSAVCIFVQYSRYSSVEGSICRTQQGQQEPLKRSQLFTLQKDYVCPCVG